MPLLLIIELVLHTILLALGIAAIKGCHWAAVVFIVVMIALILVDAIILVSAVRNGNDVRRWTL